MATAKATAIISCNDSDQQIIITMTEDPEILGNAKISMEFEPPLNKKDEIHTEGESFLMELFTKFMAGLKGDS